MSKTKNLEKFKNLVSKEKSDWLEKANWRQDNKEWLKHSQKIAVKILQTLRKNKSDKIGIGSQKELAEMLSVSPQQINKIVKGSENLTLETISKLEQVLNISLVFAEEKSSNELAEFEQTISEIEILMERYEHGKFEEFYFNNFKINKSYDLIEDYYSTNVFQVNEPKSGYKKSISQEIYTEAVENHLKLVS